MKKAILILLILVLLPCVFAKEITIAVNQSDYYFLVGEEAIVPIEFDNTYGKDISGTISYTITQEISQQGFQYSSSNSESKPFTIEDGERTIGFSFGSSQNPMTLKADISFSYTEKEDMIVNLKQISIHFVPDPSQKQNQENRQESTSEQEGAQQSQQQSMAQQMQEQLNQMFNQQPEQQTSQQALQNNQMNQDSNAVKQQMQKQLEEQRQLQEEFKKNLEQNSEFQKYHQEMLAQGYNQTGASLNPQNATDGDFEVNYGKEGEKASLKGSLENNALQDIEKSSTKDAENLMEQLRQDELFQKYEEQLNEENFLQQQPEITKENNMTTVKVPYINEKNETATITARIEDDEIKEVKLERQARRWWLLLIGLLLLVILAFFYLKYYTKKDLPDTVEEVKEKPIDYKKEARNLLEESKRLFKENRHKDAYAKAAEAIRFYYIYKINIRKELTNTELLKQLKRNKMSYKNAQKSLGLCSLVEFAKYQTNEKDFNEIISLGERIIR